jgi:hypothetical protein
VWGGTRRLYSPLACVGVMQITLDKNKLTDSTARGEYRRFPVSLTITPLGHHGGRLPSGNRRLGATLLNLPQHHEGRAPRMGLSQSCVRAAVRSEPAAEAGPAPSAKLGESTGDATLVMLRDFPLHDLSLSVDRLGGRGLRRGRFNLGLRVWNLGKSGRSSGLWCRRDGDHRSAQWRHFRGGGGARR